MFSKINFKIIFCLEMGYNGVQAVTRRDKYFYMSYKELQDLSLMYF